MQPEVGSGSIPMTGIHVCVAGENLVVALETNKVVRAGKGLNLLMGYWNYLWRETDRAGIFACPLSRVESREK